MGWFKRRSENEDEYADDEVHIGRTYIDLGSMKSKGPSTKSGGPAIKFADILVVSLQTQKIVISSFFKLIFISSLAPLTIVSNGLSSPLK